jgi:hypothetical protein
MLKHCAANKKETAFSFANVSPYIYNVKISGFTRSSIYRYTRGRQKIRFTILLPPNNFI